MGYNITIGNAVPYHHKEGGYLDAGWTVESHTSDDAPAFPNDDMTGNGNARYPSYSAWAGFARATGLTKLFFGDEGLMTQHPGCALLTQEHRAVVAAALAEYRARAWKPPGFEGWNGEDKGKYDHQLARLIWLDYWIGWALDNCETPAIRNT